MKDYVLVGGFFKNRLSNCWLMPKRDDDQAMFYHYVDGSGEERIISGLDGYAIIPRGLFEAMKTQILPDTFEALRNQFCLSSECNVEK